LSVVFLQMTEEAQAIGLPLGRFFSQTLSVIWQLLVIPANIMFKEGHAKKGSLEK
jgi:hypothetical protein